MATRWMARKRAQRALPSLQGMSCENCGATGALERHHPNYSEPDRVEVLCHPCHVKADQRDGHRRTKEPKACKVCGTMFVPSHSKKHSTCSAACLSAIGRINALNRWDAGRQSPTSQE